MDKRTKEYKESQRKKNIHLSDKEHEYLTNLFKNLKSTLDKEDAKECLKIYRREVYGKQKSTTCGSCWKKILVQLKKLL